MSWRATPRQGSLSYTISPFEQSELPLAIWSMSFMLYRRTTKLCPGLAPSVLWQVGTFIGFKYNYIFLEGAWITGVMCYQNIASNPNYTRGNNILNITLA